MGSQFSFIYDIIVVAVLAAAVFSGAHKGFVSKVVGLAAGLVGFICAISLSGPVGNWAYSSFVEKPLSEAVSTTLDESMGSITLPGVAGMDFDKVKVSGVPVTDIVPEYSGTEKAVFDLSQVDLSETGFDPSAMGSFGFGSGTDITVLNGKAAEFTHSDIERSGLGKLVTAQVIAVKMLDTPLFSEISGYVGVIGQTVPALFGDTADSISNGNSAALRSLVLTMINTSGSVRDSIMDHMIRPLFTMAVQTVAFVVIFAVVFAVIEIIASALKIVNKIPVVGSVNRVLGCAAGLVSGLLSVAVICIVVRLLVSLTDGSVIFLNNDTIGQTVLFRHFYDMGFLNFFS